MAWWRKWRGPLFLLRPPMQTRFLFVIIILFALFFEPSWTQNYSKTCFRRPPRHDETSEFTFIHVGGTGGSKLMKSLHGIFKIASDFHLCAPSIKDVKGRPALITIEEPVSRTLSIWGKHSCSPKNGACFDSHQKLYQCFPSLNDFLEARGKLPSADRSTLSDSCSQFADSPLVASNYWQLDHRWHLRKFESHFIRRHIFPVRQSNLADDFYAFCLASKFERERCSHAKKRLDAAASLNNLTVPNDSMLSNEAREFLESELEEEIKMYNNLLVITYNRTQVGLKEEQRFVKMMLHKEREQRKEKEKKVKEKKKKEKTRRTEAIKRRKNMERKYKESAKKVKEAEIRMYEAEERARKKVLRERDEEERLTKIVLFFVVALVIFFNMCYCLWNQNSRKQVEREEK